MAQFALVGPYRPNAVNYDVESASTDVALTGDAPVFGVGSLLYDI